MLRTIIFSAAFIFSSFNICNAQTLNQKAHDKIYDELANFFAKSTNGSKELHLLDFPYLITWVANDFSSDQQLVNLASLIPEESFSLDPNDQEIKLHDVYGKRIIQNIVFPQLEGEDLKKYDAAKTRLKEAFDEYDEAFKNFEDRWDKHQVRLTTIGRKVTNKELSNFLNSSAGNRLIPYRNEMNESIVQYFRNAPWSVLYERSLAKYFVSYMNAGEKLLAATSYMGYYADNESLKALMKNKCTVGDDLDGWTKIRFDSNLKNYKRTEQNKGGRSSWKGVFFKGGGGGSSSSYDQLVTTENEFIEIGFCNLRYIDVGPGDWFDAALLEDISEGKFKLREGAEEFKIYGEDGLIPRMVSGFVVASAIRIKGKINTTKESEFKKTVRGKGGFKIGPFKIGGGGGKVEMGEVTTGQNGEFYTSTKTDLPIIIAVLTQKTRE
ncbi:hypothetical protein FUA23_21835 [Neolewinella aurantiaca]|uniref:Uncharacterized protein n=1 Tax=Neolewinella aurantiaca TaxID=2602767 RepID=A0A5C7FCX0_9BACT|nr:hypothetical protein [Neolewinella aurantiaca]TXF82344.1 hypothetical protein FUA23_21835 [Neolewinella aurantiaca]